MIEYFENDILDADVYRLNDLLQQLNPLLSKVNFKRVEEVMRKEYIFSARDTSKKDNNSKGELVGMATLIPLVKLVAFFGNVENVVVDAKYRGQGIGKELIKRIIDKGKMLNMEYLFLSSGKNREVARAIYNKYKFQEEHNLSVFKLYYKKK